MYKLGYVVTEIGETQQRFVAGAGGELVPLTEGSIRPIAETRTHAGVVKVTRYTSMP